MNYNPVNKLESYYGIIRRILAEGKEKKNKKWPTNQKKHCSIHWDVG